MKQLKLLLAAALLFTSAVMPVMRATAQAATNLITNPSAETASGNTATGWTTEKWGTNTTAFTIKAEGHTGSKSLYVNTTAYTSGDAKWLHGAVTVTPNTAYTFSNWYKSSVASEVVLKYLDSANNETYVDLPAATASASAWKQQTATFTTPATATKVVVLHLLGATGWLQTDDYSLSTGTTTPTDPTPPTTGTNLVANNSFETASGTAPASWSNNKWGTNTTAFTYDTTGRTDARSAKIATTAYTNGDAKWYANAVNVTAGKTYTYSDYYKSGVATEVMAAYINGSGVYSYAGIGTASASASSWNEFSGSFTVPTGITQVTIYHLLSAVGTLSIDDVSLTESTPPTTPTNPVPNPSVETGTTAPTNWTSSSWGTNTPSFQYVTNDGHAGSKSVKVTLSNYTDGDAKWHFNPSTAFTPGKQYRMNMWYKTNVIPKVVAMYLDANGTAQYFGMPAPQPGADAATVWQKYSDTFRVPENAKSVSVFMFIDRNGWVQTDDYSVESYTPTAFNNALLTLTFDDGHEENSTNALPLLEQYGFKSTQCFATTFIEGQPQPAQSNVMKFVTAGHEICSHSVTHPMMTTLDATTLDYEAKHSQEYLKALTGQPVLDFATPYGDYNADVNTTLKKYYQAHRTVDEGFNSKDNYDPYRLRVQNILDTTTAAQVSAWIAQAQADKTWLILVYHRIANNPGPYDSTIADFKLHLDAIKASNIQVKTFQDGLAATKAQL